MFPVQVIAVWQRADAWHVGTVLYKDGGSVDVLEPWNRPCFGVPPASWNDVWEYLAERVRDGSGGNGYSYELDAFEVGRCEDIAPLVIALAAEAVPATHGPLGETAGTLIFDGAPQGSAGVMPFVLLADDRGHEALVATSPRAELRDPIVSVEDGPIVEEIEFDSVEHWQRSGAPSWPLQRGVAYDVFWSRHQARFIVDDAGRFAELSILSP
jgi:hypothetical protein